MLATSTSSNPGLHLLRLATTAASRLGQGQVCSGRKGMWKGWVRECRGRRASMAQGCLPSQSSSMAQCRLPSQSSSCSCCQLQAESARLSSRLPPGPGSAGQLMLCRWRRVSWVAASRASSCCSPDTLTPGSSRLCRQRGRHGTKRSRPLQSAFTCPSLSSRHTRRVSGAMIGRKVGSPQGRPLCVRVRRVRWEARGSREGRAAGLPLSCRLSWLRLQLPKSLRP
ncbi:hypothetical protein V8C86DRAFT_2665202 [Haematococcus lacustris]